MDDQSFERLKWLANAKTGDPLPDWLDVGVWGGNISAVCRAAVVEIEALRAVAGKARPGQTFADIRDELIRSDARRVADIDELVKLLNGPDESCIVNADGSVTRLVMVARQ